MVLCPVLCWCYRSTFKSHVHATVSYHAVVAQSTKPACVSSIVRLLQERDPSVRAAPSASADPPSEQAPSPLQPSDAVEGYVPRHPKVSSDGAKKVRFAPSAMEPASPPQPSPARMGLPGATLEAFLKGTRKPGPEAFDVIPIPPTPTDPHIPSIEDLLDQGQALRSQQASDHSPQRSLPTSQQPPSVDPASASAPAHGAPEFATFRAGSERKHQQIKPVMRKGGQLRSQVRPAEVSDSEDGSQDRSEMQDRWDDYGVVDDDFLEGHAPSAGPSLHPRDVHSDIADLGAFTQPDNAEADARSATTLPRHLQPGRGPAAQQGPVIEWKYDREAGARSEATSTQHLVPGSDDSAEQRRLTEQRLASCEQPTAMAATQSPGGHPLAHAGREHEVCVLLPGGILQQECRSHSLNPREEPFHTYRWLCRRPQACCQTAQHDNHLVCINSIVIAILQRPHRDVGTSSNAK